MHKNLIWDHMMSCDRWLAWAPRLPWQLEWSAFAKMCLQILLEIIYWSCCMVKEFLIAIWSIMSNICSISQPMFINLVLKLGKRMDYTLICNRIQRNILFVTWTQQQQMKNASQIFASTKIWNVSFDLLRKDCESF